MLSSSRVAPSGLVLAALCLPALLEAGSIPCPGTAAEKAGAFAGMDCAVAPGVDFFAYANGGWTRSTAIPPDRSSWGVGQVVTDRTDERVARLIQELAKAGAAPGSEERKIADFYAAFLDEAAIEARGTGPLRPTLEAIAAISDRAALSRALGATVRADVDVFNATDLYTPNVLGLWVAQDLDVPSRYVPFFLQGGLSMPDRDYYLDPSPRMAAIRERFASHVAAVLRLLGVPSSEVEARSARVVELERKIAAVHGSRADAEDLRKGNNHWTKGDFPVRAPGLAWGDFLSAAGLGTQPDFVVWQPAAVAGISSLAASEPIEAWKDYLALHAAEARASVLPKAFADEHFAFYGKVLTGIPEQRARWKRAVDATNEALGEAVGRQYVKLWFPPAAKARAEGMVKEIVAAFGRRIDRLSWMAPETKALAKAKLAVLKVGVGYPDRWADISGLRVEREDPFGNEERAGLFALKRSVGKLGRPVDRGEWVMTPQTVNAVNLPAMNAMNFPAAILQPPYFDPDRPLSMDFGAIGSVIGHEVSHSFDDQGALFDAEGRLRNWWTKADFEHFEAAAGRLVAQYDAYRPFPDAKVNGRQTLSENIADVAGIAVALDAWRLSIKGAAAPPFEGLTGEQQFFVSFAQSWRGKMREPALRQRLLTDGHAPGPYRVLTVRNVDAWYDAFGVEAGQALYLAPGDRVRIW